MNKYCGGKHGCGQTLPVECFYRKGNGRYQSYCKDCTKRRDDHRYKAEPERRSAWVAAWRAANPGRVVDTRDPLQKREAHLLRTYGITLDHFAGLLANQGGACAICGTTEPGGYGNQFHVDHCHVSGKIRGLLCTRHNTMLGLAFDDPALLRRAAEYLEAP